MTLPNKERASRDERPPPEEREGPPPENQMDTMRSYTAVFQNQLQEGTRTLRRPAAGQFISAISCGFDIGFGPLMMMVMLTALTEASVQKPIAHAAMSVLYTFGFIFVILGRSELYTEHSTLAVLPVLDGREPIRRLGRLWTLVWTGNTIGGTFIAIFAAWVGPAMHIVSPHVFVEIGMTFIDLPPAAIFGGAILAGWLMGLLSWILTSVGDTISRVVVILLTTYLIGFAHLPHCVAGNIEVIAAIMSGADITWIEWARFLAVTTIGNTIGGVVFVSLVKYGHVTFGSEKPDVDVEVYKQGPSTTNDD